MAEVAVNETLLNAEEKPAASETPFRVFKTQKDFDDFSAHLIRKAEEKALKNATVTESGTTFDAKEYEAKVRKDLEAKIRADIERQAQMTEAERLAEERAKLEDSIKQEKIEINRDRARVLLERAGFEEDEMDVYLDFVNEDRDLSLGKIMRVCESRKSNQEKLLSKWQTELQTSNPTLSIGREQTITAEQAKNMSLKERTELRKSNPALYESLFRK